MRVAQTATWFVVSVAATGWGRDSYSPRIMKRVGVSPGTRADAEPDRAPGIIEVEI